MVAKQPTPETPAEDKLGSKSEELTSALGNVPGGDDITTQLTNRKIEQILNNSLLQPESIPSAERPQLEGGDIEVVVQVKEKEKLEQFAEEIAEHILEESLINQGTVCVVVCECV